MVKRLYHGSTHIIENRIFGYGKSCNNYGLGFYCTADLDMAKERGPFQDQNGYANCYDLDCSDLQILDLNRNGYCILNRFAVLLENRVPFPLFWRYKQKKIFSKTSLSHISAITLSLDIVLMTGASLSPKTSLTAPFPTAN